MGEGRERALLLGRRGLLTTQPIGARRDFTSPRKNPNAGNHSAGIISVIFGPVLVSRPLAGALAMVWIIGTYALIFGVVMVVLTFRLRGLLAEG